MSDENGTLFESAMEFPCSFPIKVMGNQGKGIEEFVRETIEKHVPKKQSLEIHSRESSGGKYVSVTALFEADNREQLDKIYQILTKHPDVKMVL